MGEAALRGQVTMILRRKVAVRQMAPMPNTNSTTNATTAAAAHLVNVSNGGLTPQQMPMQSPQQQSATQVIRYPYDVIVSRNENEGFGFVISSSQYYGSTIGE